MTRDSETTFKVKRSKVKVTGGKWRSKALRGPGSILTWDPPFPSPPFPLPPLPLPLSLLFLFLSPAPCRQAATKSSLGSAVSSPVESGVEPQPKSNLVHFSLIIRHLVATILMIFLRVLPKIFLWPHYSGAPGPRGPGSLNRLNPRFLRHCRGRGLIVVPPTQLVGC